MPSIQHFRAILGYIGHFEAKYGYYVIFELAKHTKSFWGEKMLRKVILELSKVIMSFRR